MFRTGVGGYKDIILVNARSTGRLLAAIALALQLDDDVGIATYILDDECWDCCSRVVYATDKTYHCFIRIA